MIRGNSKIAFVVFIILLCPRIKSQDVEKSDLEKFREKYQQDLNQFNRQNDDAYEIFKKQQDNQFEIFKTEVEKRWQNFKKSTQTKFVRYSENLDSRSEIDFEKGIIEVEVQIEDTEESAQSIEKKVLEELKAIVSVKDAESISIVEDQLPKEILQPQENIFDNNKARKFIQKKKPKKTNVVAKDKKKRATYSIKVPLVKNHLSKRAKKYEKIIYAQAERFDLSPSLVMAIVHVESHFNPMARSHIPAFGLMQLVPESGGRDAYSKLFGRDWIPSDKYLYSPKKNVELGCNYLHILNTEYFKSITDKSSRELCVIAGYNTGSGNVSRAFTGKKNVVNASKKINKLTSRKVKQRLLNRLPYKETKKYLMEVLEQRKLYL